MKDLIERVRSITRLERLRRKLIALLKDAAPSPEVEENDIVCMALQLLGEMQRNLKRSSRDFGVEPGPAKTAHWKTTSRDIDLQWLEGEPPKALRETPVRPGTELDLLPCLSIEVQDGKPVKTTEKTKWHGEEVDAVHGAGGSATGR